MYVDAAEVAGFNGEYLLASARREVEAKLRHSMLTSVHETEEEDPDRADRAGNVDETALRSDRTTESRKRDIVNAS